MAKFKQLDVLKLADNEDPDNGTCFNYDGEVVNIGSNTAVPAGTSDPASAMGYCTNAGYQWEGDHAVSSNSYRPGSLNISSINCLKSSICSNTVSSQTPSFQVGIVL